MVFTFKMFVWLSAFSHHRLLQKTFVVLPERKKIVSIPYVTWIQVLRHVIFLMLILLVKVEKHLQVERYLQTTLLEGSRKCKQISGLSDWNYKHNKN